MCQREYLISKIFRLLLVLLKRAYFPRIAVSHKCFKSCLKTQFLKQGPAYKKEGPDPNKGSNQQ